ncbi:MAG TPA: ABC transporter permease [Chloroflexota bacterium]|jgi:peptide/nickel transport system permease protein
MSAFPPDLTARDASESPLSRGGASSPSLPPEAIEPRRRGRLLRRFLRHRLAVASLLILLVVVLISVFAPVIAPYNPSATDINNLTASGPSSAHWLGTDDIGEDVLSRVVFGGRISLSIGAGAALLSLVLGVLIGAVAGWFGGVVDTLLMRFVDLMLCFPALFLLLIFFALVPASELVIVLFLGLFGWMYLARIVRGEFLMLKEQEFVQSALALGVGSRRIIWRHLLPNVVGVVIVTGTLNVAYNMLAEATLDFLGYGVPPDIPTWGNMLTTASNHYIDQPLLAIAPGLTLTIVILCINFLGDGLRDALDPRMS